MNTCLFAMFLLAALVPFVLSEAKIPQEAAALVRNPVYESLEPSFDDSQLHLRQGRQARTESLQQNLENLFIDAVDSVVRSVRSAEEDDDDEKRFNFLEKHRDLILLDGNTNTSIGSFLWQFGKGESGTYCLVASFISQYKNPMEMMAGLRVLNGLHGNN